MNPSGQRAWEMDDPTPCLGASWVACWGAAAPQAAAAVAAAARGGLGHFEGLVPDPPLGDADLVGRPGHPDPGSPGAARTPPGHRARHHRTTAGRGGPHALGGHCRVLGGRDPQQDPRRHHHELEPGAERLYGYTAAEMVGQPLTRLIPPDLADDLPQILARLRRGECLDHYETQRVTKDGTRLDIALTISPIQNGAGQISGASTIARDITARKQADAELERRRQETALLAEIAQQLSASLDLDTVLQRLVTGAHALCRSERAFLALRDPGTDTLVGRYEIGAPERAYAGVRIAAGAGLGGQVLRTGQPWRTDGLCRRPALQQSVVGAGTGRGTPRRPRGAHP